MRDKGRVSKIFGSLSKEEREDINLGIFPVYIMHELTFEEREELMELCHWNWDREREMEMWHDFYLERKEDKEGE